MKKVLGLVAAVGLFASGRAAHAHIDIAVVDTPYRVTVRFTPDEDLHPNERLLVVSGFDRRIVGYLLLLSVDRKTGQAMAKVISHEKNALMLAGDTAIRVDYKAKEPTAPGRTDLMNSEKGTPIRYRPLVYLNGGPTESAQTLNPGENALSIMSYFERGITPRLTLGTIAVADGLGLTNLSAKFRVFDFDDVAAALGVMALYYPGQGTWGEVFTGHLDVQSNSKFIQHNQLTIYHSDIQFNRLSSSSTVAHPARGSFLRSTSEYVLDSWDRLLFGPHYNFDRKTLGGTVSYVFLWDHLQFMLGINVDDFSRFKVDEYGYQPQVDLYWIFP